MYHYYCCLPNMNIYFQRSTLGMTDDPTSRDPHTQPTLVDWITASRRIFWNQCEDTSCLVLATPPRKNNSGRSRWSTLLYFDSLCPPVSCFSQVCWLLFRVFRQPVTKRILTPSKSFWPSEGEYDVSLFRLFLGLVWLAQRIVLTGLSVPN